MKSEHQKINPDLRQEQDWTDEKYPQPKLSLDNWRELVSEQGKEKIEALIKEEILKKIGS